MVARVRRFRRHCLIMRSAMAVQIFAIGLVMAPSLAGYLNNWHGWSLFLTRVIVHQSLGVIVVLLFIYINLAYTGVIRAPRSFRPYMISALTLWVISLVTGVLLYWRIWV